MRILCKKIIYSETGIFCRAKIYLEHIFMEELFMEFLSLDFSTLQDIPPLQRYYEMPRVSITPKGLFSMNSAFRKEAGAQRRFQVRISPDGRYLVLYPTELANVCFSAKNGHMTHTPLAKSLKERGIRLPALYTVTWCQEHEAWIGSCQELPAPPHISTLNKPTGAGKKTAVRKSA